MRDAVVLIDFLDKKYTKNVHTGLLKALSTTDSLAYRDGDVFYATLQKMDNGEMFEFDLLVNMFPNMLLRRNSAGIEHREDVILFTYVSSSYESNPYPIKGRLHWENHIIVCRLNGSIKGSYSLIRSPRTTAPKGVKQYTLTHIENIKNGRANIDMDRLAIDAVSEALSTRETEEDSIATMDLNMDVSVTDPATFYKNILSWKEGVNSELKELRQEVKLLKAKLSDKSTGESLARSRAAQSNYVHWYWMSSRPVGVGSLPDGYIRYDPEVGNRGIVAYREELSEEQIKEYGLEYYRKGSLDIRNNVK